MLLCKIIAILNIALCFSYRCLQKSWDSSFTKLPPHVFCSAPAWNDSSHVGHLPDTLVAILSVQSKSKKMNAKIKKLQTKICPGHNTLGARVWTAESESVCVSRPAESSLLPLPPRRRRASARERECQLPSEEASCLESSGAKERLPRRHSSGRSTL